MPHRCDSSDGLESLVDDFDGLAINNNRGGGGGRFNGSYRPDKIYINDKKEAQMATRLLCSRPQDFLPSLDRGTRKLAAMQALLLEFDIVDKRALPRTTSRAKELVKANVHVCAGEFYDRKRRGVDTIKMFASQQAVRQHLSDMRKNQQKWGHFIPTDHLKDSLLDAILVLVY